MSKRANLTQPELAEKVGVHETTIRRWEQERDKGPDAKTVNILAEVLKTTPDYLLSNTETELDEGERKDRLVYEWSGGHRLDLPDTPETRPMFERLVLSIMSNPTV